MRPVVSEQPVNSPLAAQYADAVSTGHYRRWPTVVLCSCGDTCPHCAEPAPTLSRPWSLRARVRRGRA